MNIAISLLRHTWLIDIDGTILRHNGYKFGEDSLLPGVVDFWDGIPKLDYILLMSARGSEHKELTLDFLRKSGLWWTNAVFGLPAGERILINDSKPSGLITAVALNLVRNSGMSNMTIELNPKF